MLFVPQEALDELDGVALGLIGENARKKAAMAESLRLASFRGFVAAGADPLDAFEGAELMAARLRARIEEFELLVGNA